jgi:hypothetical protein
MDTLRIYQKPKKGVLTIKLPENMATTNELEIIIIQVDKKTKEAKKRFNPTNFFGIWREKNIDADKLSKKMKTEWDRDF